MGSLIHLEMLKVIMWVIGSHSWYLIGEIFSVLIEEVFVAFISLPRFQVS